MKKMHGRFFVFVYLTWSKARHDVLNNVVRFIV
jgi:hypothetical protein